MSATIRVRRLGGIVATITDFEWQCDEAWAADWLNAQRPTYGPSGADPNPDLHEAMRIVEEHGGELLAFSEMPYVADREY